MDKDLAELARWWCWRRQRLDRTCRGVEDALRSVIGVPGANPWGPLSLLARVPRLLRGAAVEGVIDTKRAVRVPAVRRSFYLMPADTAPYGFGVARSTWRPARHLRRAGVAEEAYEELRREILLASGTPRTALEIAGTLGRPLEEVRAAVAAICEEGDLLMVKARSIRSADFTYVATRIWLGADLRRVPEEEALTWLAGDYLTAFGPATAGDLAHWTGAPPARAGEALAAHDPVDLGGGTFLHRRDEKAFTGMRPHLGRVNLLPRYDAYTMGYSTEGRARFAQANIVPLVYDSSDNPVSVVMIEGRVTGTWEVRFPSEDRALVLVSLAERPGPRERAAIEEEAGLVGAFLEARETRVEIRALERRPAPKARRPPSGRPKRGAR